MTILTVARQRLPLHQLSTWTVLAAGCGLLGAIPVVPVAVSGILVGLFVLVGPGAAVVDHFTATLPKFVVTALVPLVSLSLMVLLVSGTLMLGLWAPKPVLLILAAATGVAGVLRLRHDQAMQR